MANDQNRTTLNSYIFLPIEQFFIAKHTLVVNQLAENFQLILSKKNHGFEIDNPKNVEYIDDIINPVTFNDIKTTIKKESSEFLKYMVLEASRILGNPVNKDSINNLYKNAQNNIIFTIISVANFRRLLKHRGISLVIASADCTPYSRPVVLEAKKHNIKTLNIEHGVNIFQNYAEVVQDKVKANAGLISDFVIVENDLEANIRSSYAKKNNHKQNSVYLPIGTPLDEFNKNNSISRQEALKVLGLSKKKQVLAICGTWAEPRTPATLLMFQKSEAEFFRFVFKAVTKFRYANDLQIVIKLHPALRFFQEDDIVDFYHDLAKSVGIDSIKVFYENLEEVLSSADYLISTFASTILWHGLNRGIPIATSIPNIDMHLMHTDMIYDTNEFVKAQLMDYVFSCDEVVTFLEKYLHNTSRSDLINRRDKFFKKWKIKPDSVNKAVDRLISWIKTNFSELTI